MDVFRPKRQPAQAICDAFQKESELRDRRDVDEWVKAERQVVFEEACVQASRMGMICPTLEQVIQAEQSAYGHVDYGAKWAYGVVDAMRREEAS